MSVVPQQRATGFALIVVVALIALSGASAVALASAFAAHARRTRGLRHEAQLRQLLLAGAARAQVDAESTASGASGTLPLPATLSNRGASVTVAPLPTGDPGIRGVEVSAVTEGSKASQVVTFRRGAAGWVATDAALAP